MRTVQPAYLVIVFGCLWVVPALAESPGEPAYARRQVFQRLPGLYEPVAERPNNPPATPDVLSGRTSSAAAPIGFGPYAIVQVNVDALGNNIVGDAGNEPTLAIDPTDPSKLAVAWRQFDSVSSDFRQAGMAYSTDHGESWISSGPIDPGVFRSDPVLGSDSAGNFYFSSLTHNEIDPNIFEVNVFKSTDGGITWPSSAYAYGGDKQWIAVDRRTSGMGAGHIYQYWSSHASCCGPENFNRSTNGGSTFEFPVDLSFPPMIWGTLDVNSDGVLYVGGRTFSGYGHLVTRSTTASNPGAAPTFEEPVLVNLDGFTGGFGGFDGPNPAGLLGHVWVAVNPRGHVFLLSSVVRWGGDPCDVMFARSVDAGLTWSEPVRVNDDAEFNNAWQWFGTMSVAPNGRIDVTWNDTRGSGEAQVSALYYSYSLDEGQTWSTNQQISPEFNSHLGFPQQTKMGDYAHMISDDGGANLAFAATFNGEQDVYFVRIGQDCNESGIDDDCDVVCGSTGSRCAVAGCGQASDCNHNNIPDSCEPDEDCNENVVRDLCELGLDCNANRRIDSCETNQDCNANQLLDVCDLFLYGDCNRNGKPDDCDAGITSTDRNTDDIPDECQGSCCLCGPCDDRSEIECFLRGGIFAGPDILCGEPDGCVSPLFEHDLCSQSFELPSAPQYTTYIDNRCASWDKPYEVPCPTSTFLGADLWYTYKAPCSGTAEFSMCDTTAFDAMLAIYGTSTSCTCPTTNTNPISCQDDSCGFPGGPPVITRSVVAGRCYTIRVGGWEGSIGTGDLSISYLSSCNPTDLNASGQTDLRDFALFDNCFGPVRVGCASSDFNRDNVIDVNDYRALQAMLGL